jgi:hypothetical protein
VLNLVPELSRCRAGLRGWVPARAGERNVRKTPPAARKRARQTRGVVTGRCGDGCPRGNVRAKRRSRHWATQSAGHRSSSRAWPSLPGPRTLRPSSEEPPPSNLELAQNSGGVPKTGSKSIGPHSTTHPGQQRRSHRSSRQQTPPRSAQKIASGAGRLDTGAPDAAPSDRENLGWPEANGVEAVRGEQLHHALFDAVGSTYVTPSSGRGLTTSVVRKARSGRGFASRD